MSSPVASVFVRVLHTLARTAPLALALLAAPACTSLIGVEEVELAEEPPPPPPPNCNVASRIPLVSSNPSTSVISRRPPPANNLSMVILLNTDPKPDSLGVLIYNNMGNHGVIEAPGTYSITAADSKLETCGICVLVNTDYDNVAKKFLETFMAEPQGSLVITTATSTRIAGHFSDLKLRRVDTTGGSTREVSDPCSVAIDDVYFDMTIPPVEGGIPNVAASAAPGATIAGIPATPAAADGLVGRDR